MYNKFFYFLGISFITLFLSGCSMRSHEVENKWFKTSAAYELNSVDLISVNSKTGFFDIAVNIDQVHGKYRVITKKEGCQLLSCFTRRDYTSSSGIDLVRTSLNSQSKIYSILKLSIGLTSDLHCKPQKVLVKSISYISGNKYRIYLDRKYLDQDNELKMDLSLNNFDHTLKWSYEKISLDRGWVGQKVNTANRSKTLKSTESNIVLVDGFCEETI